MALVITEEMGKIKCWVTVKDVSHTWFKHIQVTGMNKYKLYTHFTFTCTHDTHSNKDNLL